MVKFIVDDYRRRRPNHRAKFMRNYLSSDLAIGSENLMKFNHRVVIFLFRVHLTYW